MAGISDPPCFRMCSVSAIRPTPGSVQPRRQCSSSSWLRRPKLEARSEEALLLLVPLLVGVVLFNAGFAVHLRPLSYTLPPLQRYYLDAYLASSWNAKDPAAQTDFEWIMRPAHNFWVTF